MDNPEKIYSVLFRAKTAKYKVNMSESNKDILYAESVLQNIFKKQILRNKIKKADKPVTKPKFNSKRSKKARERIKKFKRIKQEKK